VPVIVLELDPKAPDVAVDDVALGHEVGAPDGVEDVLPRDDPATPAGEEVEEALLPSSPGLWPIGDPAVRVANPKPRTRRKSCPPAPAG
jgi:hypothetical protein